jgi:hypothetical protein
MEAENGELLGLPADSLPTDPSATGMYGWLSSYSLGFGVETEPVRQLQGKTLTVPLELKALQPQREVSPKAQVAIAAKKTCTISIHARIYADTLPEPLLQRLSIQLTVKQVSLRAAEILNQLGVKLPS